MSKKADIINATKTLLWNVGYEAMSPRKIMDASGAGQGSLYHHFPGKEQLAAKVLLGVANDMKADVDQLFDPGLPPTKRIKNFLLAKRDAIKGCPLGRLANETSIQKPSIKDPIAGFFSYVEHKIQSSLEEAIEKEEITSDTSPKELAVTLLAGLQGGFALSRIHNNPDYLQYVLEGSIKILNNLKKNTVES